MNRFDRRPATADDLTKGEERCRRTHPCGFQFVCRQYRWSHPEVVVYTYSIFFCRSGETWELVWEEDFQDLGQYGGREPEPVGMEFNEEGTAILVVMEGGAVKTVQL